MNIQWHLKNVMFTSSSGSIILFILHAFLVNLSPNFLIYTLEKFLVLDFKVFFSVIVSSPLGYTNKLLCFELEFIMNNLSLHSI